MHIAFEWWSGMCITELERCCCSRPSKQRVSSIWTWDLFSRFKYISFEWFLFESSETVFHNTAWWPLVCAFENDFKKKWMRNQKEGMGYNLFLCVHPNDVQQYDQTSRQNICVTHVFFNNYSSNGNNNNNKAQKCYRIIRKGKENKRKRKKEKTRKKKPTIRRPFM